MNRTKLFFYNSLSSVIMQIVTIITGMLIPRIMIVTYGSEINGLVSSITQFIGYFTLVEAGLGAASIYALYKPLAENDHKGVSEIVSATTKYFYLSGYIFCGLVLGFSLLYPMFIHTRSLSAIEVGLLVLVIGVSGTLNFFTLAKYQVLITADQRIYIINYLLSVSTIVNAIIIIVMTKLQYDILLLRFVALLSVFIPPIFLHFYVKKYYTYVNFKEIPNNKALHKRWDALILQLLGSIQTAAPIILATIFTSLALVSVYSIFNMVIAGVMGVLSIFGTGLSASFGQLIAAQEHTIFRKAYNEFELMSYIIIAFLFSCCMVLIMPFINLYTAGVHDVNYNQPIIGFLFVLNAILYSIKGPQGTLVSSAGFFKETKYQTLLQASIALILGAILAKPLGLSGILIGLIASNLYRDIDLLIFIPRKLNNTNIKLSFLRAARLFIQLAVIWIPFRFIKMNIGNYLQWIITAVIVVIYSMSVIVISSFLMERKSFLSLSERVMSLFNRG